MAHTVYSGRQGAVNGHTNIAQWSASVAVDLQKVRSSATKGGTVALDGNTDWSGNFRGFGGQPAIMPGETFTFTGSGDGTLGVTGPAICENVEVVIDIESGAPVSYTVNFAGNGAPTLGAAAATDTTAPDVSDLSSIGCKIQQSAALDAPSFAVIPDVATITVRITSENPAYVSSSTAGAKKRFGGNIDAEVSYKIYEGSPADLIAPNSVKALRVFVNATEFYEFNWMKYGNIDGFDVNRDSVNVVSCTQNSAMRGFTDTDATPDKEGSIKLPDATTWWP